MRGETAGRREKQSLPPVCRSVDRIRRIWTYCGEVDAIEGFEKRHEPMGNYKLLKLSI